MVGDQNTQNLADITFDDDVRTGVSQANTARTGGSNPESSTTNSSLLTRPIAIGLLLLLACLIGLSLLRSPDSQFTIADRIQTFVTIFLGIFIEAVPFLLAGSLVSGFIAVFVNQAMLDRFLPKQPILAAFSGALLGLIFPVCECGVVPVTRRLYEKGLPLSIGVAFLLSAPVINPVVFVSTYAAFGWGPVLIGRVLLTIVIAFVIGLIFQLASGAEVLLPNILRRTVPTQGASSPLLNSHNEQISIHSHEHAHSAAQAPLGQRIASALHTSGDDFIDMGRYLIVGSMLAAGMQTLVPQSALLAVGQGSLLSVLVMQVMAFVLSVCSTVDAFLALAFTGTFTTGSIVAFLTFGPMVDIKSALMFLGVFQRRIVFYLIAVPFCLSLLAGLLWNVLSGIG